MNYDAYLTDGQLAKRYSVSRSSIWRWRKSDPTFPQAVHLSKGCTRFRLSDVEAWEKQRVAASEPL